jgi:nitrite reductase/ring-hydroxylating ferredoxin subunit
MSDETDPGSQAHDCEECPLLDRRRFLRAVGFAAGATVLFAGDVAGATAVPRVGASRTTPEEKTYPIPAADGVQIDKSQDLILSRAAGKLYAFSLACPHQNTAIKWEDGNRRFQCPNHHSIYTPEGVFVEGRATRGLDRFVTRKEGNSVVVNLDSLLQEDTDGEKWKKAFLTL